MSQRQNHKNYKPINHCNLKHTIYTVYFDYKGHQCTIKAQTIYKIFIRESFNLKLICYDKTYIKILIYSGIISLEFNNL